MNTKTLIATMKLPILTSRFMADVLLTRGTAVTVTKGRFEPTLHILNQKQAAKVIDIHMKSSQVDEGNQSTGPVIIRQGDKATVTFEFKNRSSYLRPGMRIIIREGHVIGYGVVTTLL